MAPWPRILWIWYLPMVSTSASLDPRKGKRRGIVCRESGQHQTREPFRACVIVRRRRHGHRLGRRPGGDRSRAAGPRSLGRTLRGQAHGARGGGPAPPEGRRKASRPRPGHRGQGGGQQGARHRMEPGCQVARRGRRSRAARERDAQGRRGPQGRAAGGGGPGPAHPRAKRRAGTGPGQAPGMMEPWQRNQYVMVAVVFVVFTAFAFVLPFLPLYVRQLGVRDEHAVALWAGVLIGVSPLLAGLLAPAWGRLADRYGHKSMAARALVSYVIILLLASAVTNVWQLLATRIGIGLFGGIGPLGLAMATSLAPREETGRAVGQVQAAQILAAAVGPVMGGLMADTIGIRRTFVVTAGTCALALALVTVFYREPEAPAERERGGGSMLELLRLPRMAAMLTVLFLVNFVGRSFTPILPLHLFELGVPRHRLAFNTGLLISVYSVAAALSATLLGRASKTRPPRQLLLLTLVAGALTVLPMGFVAHFAPMLALAALLGLVSGGSLTLCYTMGGLLAGPDRRATAFGFFSAAALFGGSVSPTVAGLLVGWNLRGIYYLDAALLLALSAALLLGALPPVAAAPAGAQPERA